MLPVFCTHSTNKFARSDWSNFLMFLFLILLLPILYRFGSSFNAILPSSCATGVLAIFLANFKILFPKPHPCWSNISQEVYLVALLFVCKDILDMYLPRKFYFLVELQLWVFLFLSLLFCLFFPFFLLFIDAVY